MSSTIVDLREWLRREAPALRDATVAGAPNLLAGADEVGQFLETLMGGLGEGPDTQLAAIQSWALSAIGDDELLATDWLALVRVIKERLGSAMRDDFSGATALRFWRELDPLFNHALVEVTRLAAEPDRQTHLEHVAALRRDLDRFNRSKSNFVAVAAHELKTPLTLLEGYTQMMRAELPDGEERLMAYLDGFDKGTHRLRMIVEDMLDVSVLEAQSLDLSFQQFHLHHLLLGAVGAVDTAFSERDVAIEIHIAPEQAPGPFYGDPERLEQALVKIIENGIKYTPDGGRVGLSGERTRREEATRDIDGYFDIQITDTGIGIAADDLSAIFEKFATTQNVALHSSGKARFKGGGPGLGLPIARGIIEAHGGRVWAESPGYDEERCPGSTFHVELPVRVRKPDSDKFARSE